MDNLQTDRSVRGPLAEIMAERYPSFASDLALTLTYSEYDPHHFGNSILIYQGALVRLRIVVDRSQIQADMSSLEKPEIWWTVRELYGLVHGTNPELDLLLESMVIFLRQHFHDLARALGPEFAVARKADEDRKQAWIDSWQRRAAELKQSRARKSWLTRLIRRFRS